MNSARPNSVFWNLLILKSVLMCDHNKNRTCHLPHFHWFLNLSRYFIPWGASVTIILFAIGLAWGLFFSPVDYQQGEAVRIMYIHVPSAWMGLFSYTVLALVSAVSLIWHYPLADFVAKATSPLGAAFTFVCLISGALWGKPMWGTYWVWDARLTSMLILMFLYLGHIALINAFDDPDRGMRAGATLALVGFINVPIIKFSVDWWNTLHQPASVSRIGLPAIATEMLLPLLVMGLAFKSYYITLLFIRTRTEIISVQIRELQFIQVQQETSEAKKGIQCSRNTAFSPF